MNYIWIFHSLQAPSWLGLNSLVAAFCMRGRRPPLLIKHVQSLLLMSATHLVTISLGFLPKRLVQSSLPMSALCSNFLPNRHAVLSSDESIPCTFLLPFPSQETRAIPAPNEFISVAISFPVDIDMSIIRNTKRKRVGSQKKSVSGSRVEIPVFGTIVR